MNALQCADCHVSTGRLDFKALGYNVKATRHGEPLCISCHGDEGNVNFYQIHNVHVQEHSISCTVCHDFKTAPLLPRGGINGVYLLLDN